MSDNRRWRIGFDIGGTFTDFILYDAAQRTAKLHKRLTTPHDPSQAALAGLDELVAEAGIALCDVSDIVHGTTLVTNAIIERKGPRLGLITTGGFRDVLEMGIEQRYDIYDLFLEFPEPLVPRHLRLEVPERIDRDGRIVTPLDLAAVRTALRRLVEAGVETVAVCFMHSYRNRGHEVAVGEIIRAEFPSLAVSLSAEVVPEMSEYQRCVTTCANAYVQPLMDRYIGRLEKELSSRGFTGELLLMHSAGGLVSVETARALPIRLLESGPAGGGLATALFGLRAGKRNIISFDMGGTTAKACMIEDGRPEIVPMMEAGRVHRFKKGSGLPIKAPVLDMIEIGAGGGSIVGIDDLGLLKVGPRSAGSDPGPACYGRGASEPTVTDACVALGYYDPTFFLGGRMKLDNEAATRALGPIASHLGGTAGQAAWAVHKLVVENMATAVRTHLVEKGKDPRAYALVGFGGAGPAHAADVARALGVKEVIIPPASGAASALGFLSAPLSFELSQSFSAALGQEFDAAGAESLLESLEQEGRRRLRDAGIPSADVRVERSADLRLAGQLHDLTVPLPDRIRDPAWRTELHSTFVDAYRARYTAVYEDAGILVTTLRVRCSGPAPVLSIDGTIASEVLPKVKGRREAWFDSGYETAVVYNRYALVHGDTLEGPAIVEEREATTVVAPGDRLRVDEALNLRIDIRVPSAPADRIQPETPLDEAIALIEADPVSLELMWGRLVTVADEMSLTVRRTAFSMAIAETDDFGCELFDVDGESLAHSPRAMPVFNITLPKAVKALISAYPISTLRPGDVLVTNNPWLLAGHLFDIAVVSPVFKNDRVVALVATVGHVSDIGGTQDWPRSSEIYEEGFQIPPLKLCDSGEWNQTLLLLLAQNIRNAKQVLGDIHSFVAANAIGAERLIKFMHDYGMSDLRAMASVVQSRSERAMRDAIAALPDGVYDSEMWSAPLGEPIRHPLKITIAGDQIELDFAGAAPQLKRGAVNCTFNYMSSHATYPLKCMLTPEVRGNAGCYRPFVLKAPEGTILNATYPAALNLRPRTGWYLAPNVFQALSRAAPNRVRAPSGLPATVRMHGEDARGRGYADQLFMGGGYGASVGQDGKSALLWPTSAANTSIEVFESRIPVLVIEKTYVPDSGGAGKHRGGLGQRVRFRKLDQDGTSTFAAVFPEVVPHPAAGFFGGRPGGLPSGSVTWTGETVPEDLGSGRLLQLEGTGDIVEVVIGGGGGYGEPQDRTTRDIQTDLLNGMVTPEEAARQYGTAIQSERRGAHEPERNT